MWAFVAIFFARFPELSNLSTMLIINPQAVILWGPLDRIGIGGHNVCHCAD